MEPLVGLIVAVAWLIGTIWLFKEQHWGWGIAGIFIPIISIIYLVYRYLPKGT